MLRHVVSVPRDTSECTSYTDGTADRSIRGACREDVWVLQDYVAAFAHHPRQLLYKGAVLISTFAGQDCLFGQTTLHEAWQLVKSVLQEIAPVRAWSAASLMGQTF